MGIVVCITLLLVLALLRPNFSNTQIDQSLPVMTRWGVSVLAFLVGSWNSFYGLDHFSDFWGVAALFSGVSLMLASVVVFRDTYTDSRGSITRRVLVLAVFACFLLYAITLIQLNLGFSYLGQ